MRRLASLCIVGIFIGLTLVFFYDWAFTDKILARGDAYSYFYPYWDARNDALRSGQLPLWSDAIFMGVPLLANPQLGTFYPPNWLTIPFRAPDAIRYSVLLHIVIASVGAYCLFCRLSAPKSAISVHALVAGMIYGFGGYVGAHVEQINQLQGLALLPWCFWLYDKLLSNHRVKGMLLDGILLSMLLSLQIFSGHTQAVFITLVGLGIYGALMGLFAASDRAVMTVRHIGVLGAVSLGAILLAIPQWVPTLELSSLSNRGDGLSIQEATAFSLPPNYIGRALLPNYDAQLFGEYIAYIGVLGLGLALLGASAKVTGSQGYSRRSPWIWAMLAGAGLALALGRFNPLYLILAELPGFNLFRVPSRWLALYSLGMAMLAGYGSMALLSGGGGIKRRARWVILFLALFIVLTRFLPVIAPTLAVQAEDIVGLAIPTDAALLMWLVPLIVFSVFVWGPWQRRWLAVSVPCLVAFELFGAGLSQPYHDLVPPATYLAQRFTVSQLLAYQKSGESVGRVLSISGLLFDTGDKASLEALYARSDMDALAIRHALVAVKRQETLFPNLSLTWGIPSVDGFDGGILPTRWYSQFSQWVTDGDPTSDGRLGEILARAECRGLCLPPPAILDKMAVQYLISDKVHDVWHDGIAYDTAFSTLASLSPVAEWRAHPAFVADEAHLLLAEAVAPLISDDGEQWLTNHHIAPMGDSFEAIYRFDTPRAIEQLVIQDTRAHKIVAVTIVDSRTGDFQQMTPSGWEKMLSSDIKLYRRDMLLGRVYLTQDVRAVGDTTPITALEADQTLLHGTIADLPSDEAFRGTARLVASSPTRLEIATSASAPSYLVVADAYYPNWSATVDEQPTPIIRADVMFRAVLVPSGEHRVIFRFQPQNWYVAIGLGVVMWVIAFGLAVGLGRHRA